ncbi:hypothetical protein OKN36_06010 [Furfurilactobacillus sp. OKN36]
MGTTEVNVRVPVVLLLYGTASAVEANPRLSNATQLAQSHFARFNFMLLSPRLYSAAVMVHVNVLV